MSMKYDVKDLYNFIYSISHDYFEAHLQLAEDDTLTQEEIDARINFILKVEDAQSKLEPFGRKLINNEFFVASNDKWWINFYTRTNFYILKKKYAKEFVKAFDASSIY